MEDGNKKPTQETTQETTRWSNKWLKAGGKNSNDCLPSTDGYVQAQQNCVAGWNLADDGLPVRAIAYELYGEDAIGGRFHLEAMNTATIISYVQRDMGVALASSYVLEWLNPADIATIELAEETDIPWGVMSDSSRPISKAAAVFVETLRRSLE